MNFIFKHVTHSDPFIIYDPGHKNFSRHIFIYNFTDLKTTFTACVLETKPGASKEYEVFCMILYGQTTM